MDSDDVKNAENELNKQVNKLDIKRLLFMISVLLNIALVSIVAVMLI